MFECPTLARIVALHGGLDALAAAPVEIAVDGLDTLFVEHLGVGPLGAPFQLISVAQLRERDGEERSCPEMHFEVMPGRNARVGWLSGTWTPVEYHNTWSPTPIHQRVPNRRRLLLENRQFAREWDREIAAAGYLEAFAAGRPAPVTCPAQRRAVSHPRPRIRLLTIPA